MLESAHISTTSSKESLLEEIENLRYHIQKVEPLVEHNLKALNEDSTFAETFAAKANAATLENKKRKLKELEKEAAANVDKEG